ncbi:MAG: hypothetical protein OEQ81_11845 [Flavobacteriaceae bacterium]|nr:hypothetical protein [Flavobacteriaceae bacterium]
MKKFNFFPIAMAAAFLFAACSTDNENDEAANIARLQADIEELTGVATSGSWVITNFVDSGQNETANFDGYGFNFNADGSLVADNGDGTVNGSWSITMDDDPDDDSFDDDSNDDNSNDDSQDDCNNCTVEQLTDVLTACSDWFVDKLQRNDVELEDNYITYSFNFSADGSVTVAASSESYTGTWEATGSGNNIQIVLTIMGLTDLEDTWTLHEIELYNGESQVDLRINGEDRLRFENRCTLGQFDGGHSSGEVDFNIFFAAPEDFNELSEDWNIVSFSNSIIELIHESGGNGGTDLLTFEKQ